DRGRAAGHPRRAVRTARPAAAARRRRAPRPQERPRLLQMGDIMISSAPRVVPSYLQDRWWMPEPTGETAVIRDASTGEEIARVSTEGLDLAAALEHGRTVGQASLGELTFHQRALVL